MTDIDRYLLLWINQYSRHSWLFDKANVFISNNTLLKGGFITAIFWYLWFKPDKNQARNRDHIVITLAVGFVAMFVARMLALTLPFRLRPIHQEGLPFVLPFGMDSTELQGWSSFPSDHAVLFFALASGIFFISKKWSLLALFHSVLVVTFPRIYLGMHYPSDIVAGALLGIAISVTGNIYLNQSRIIHGVSNISLKKPEIFYPLLFIFTFEIAEMFGSFRSLAGAFLKSLLH
jgi:undecaprenyl-diphosphatase